MLKKYKNGLVGAGLIIAVVGSWLLVDIISRLAVEDCANNILTGDCIDRFGQRWSMVNSSGPYFGFFAAIQFIGFLLILVGLWLIVKQALAFRHK